MRKTLLIASGVALLLAAPAAGQTVRAGMTLSEVRGTLGDPAAVRVAGDWTYLFYANGCPVRCGSDDVVFLRDGQVVSAVFRTRRRRFVGPAAASVLEGTPAAARAPRSRAPGTPPDREERTGAARDAGRPGEPSRAVQGIRIRVPGTEDVSTGGDIVIRPSGAAARGDTLLADSALDQSRQRREQQVTPRTIPPDRPGASAADTALDRSRQRRERQVTPRTVRPRTTTGRPPR